MTAEDPLRQGEIGDPGRVRRQYLPPWADATSRQVLCTRCWCQVMDDPDILRRHDGWHLLGDAVV